jgi:hypothetical protein
MNCEGKYCEGRTMDWNKLWQKYFPHLSPKEAHAELMQMFPKGGKENESK